jgi:8-oxo-dGTP diphosphatase
MNDIFGGHGRRPTVAADCVVLTFRDERAWVLLVERGNEPFKGKWALPGGFMEWGESCEKTARRELEEETSLSGVKLEFLGIFSKPGRDPRGTIVSTAFIGLVNSLKAAVRAHDDAAKAEWFPFHDHPELAFDHLDIVQTAKDYIVRKLKDKEYGWFARLLPQKFTLHELAFMLEKVSGLRFKVPSLRTALVKKKVLIPCGHNNSGFRNGNSGFRNGNSGNGKGKFILYRFA